MLERQARRYDDTLLVINPAGDFEEKFRTGLGERAVTQFIPDQQIAAADLFEEPLEPAGPPGVPPVRSPASYA